MSATVWYDLELMSVNGDNSFYKTEYNRSDSNAGYDVYAVADLNVKQTAELIPFGVVARLLRVEQMPGGTSNDYLRTESHFWLVPRSSIYKSGLMMANSVGTIDKSYRGELKAPVWSMTGNSDVMRGSRLFQIVAPDMGWIRNVMMVESMPDTMRGAGGFGSTGQ